MDNGQRDKAQQAAPALPTRQLDQDVRAADQDETMARMAPEDLPDRVDGKARAEASFGIAHDDAGIRADQAPGAREPFRKRRHAGRGLQGILRRDQPPEAVEPKAREREPADREMGRMGRVEGAAVKPDAERQGRT
jgi:hypothetical protein